MFTTLRDMFRLIDLKSSNYIDAALEKERAIALKRDEHKKATKERLQAQLDELEATAAYETPFSTILSPQPIRPLKGGFIDEQTKD